MKTNQINYVLLNNDEWAAFKKNWNWGVWVDHARYYDRFDDGTKCWWVYFKFPLMSITFLEMAKSIGVELYKNQNKL